MTTPAAEYYHVATRVTQVWACCDADGQPYPERTDRTPVPFLHLDPYRPNPWIPELCVDSDPSQQPTLIASDPPLGSVLMWGFRDCPPVDPFCPVGNCDLAGNCSWEECR